MQWGKRKEKGERRKEEGGRRKKETAFYQDHHPATYQQTLASREKHVGEKSPGKHEERGRERGWQREPTGERERQNQPPDASYYDAQGATPRASLEGEPPAGGGGKGVAEAGVAKTLIRSSGHVGLFLRSRFFLSSRGKFEPLTPTRSTDLNPCKGMRPTSIPDVTIFLRCIDDRRTQQDLLSLVVSLSLVLHFSTFGHYPSYSVQRRSRVSPVRFPSSKPVHRPSFSDRSFVRAKRRRFLRSSIYRICSSRFSVLKGRTTANRVETRETRS